MSCFLKRWIIVKHGGAAHVVHGLVSYSLKSFATHANEVFVGMRLTKGLAGSPGVGIALSIAWKRVSAGVQKAARDAKWLESMSDRLRILTCKDSNRLQV